jgi:hypothetical protein
MKACRMWRVIGLLTPALIGAAAQPMTPAAASSYSARPSDVGYGIVVAGTPSASDSAGASDSGSASGTTPASDAATISAAPTFAGPPTPSELPTPTELPTPSGPPSQTDPSTATAQPSPTDPSTATEQPSPTDPSTATEQPSPTDPSTVTQQPTPTTPAPSTPAPSTPPPTPSSPDVPPSSHSGPPTHSTSNGGPTGGVTHPKPGVKTRKPARPHPHKTLRPKPAATHPGISRPHPHRKPWPITLTIKTVPSLAGVHFTFDGKPLVTGANGMTSYTAEHDFARHRLSVTSNYVTISDHRYQFNRWAGQRDPNQAFSHTVSGLPLRTNYLVTAAFTVQQQVLPRVVRQDGTPLDSTEVTAITARSDSGAVVALPLTGPTWLDGFRPAFHHSVLSAEPVSYSLQSVMVRGTNVVDAGRQTFKPSATGNPTFTTQFHDLVITGHDAIFKSGRGTSATVTFPDGGKLTVPLNAEHTALLRDLPRGKYQVVIEAGRSIVGVQQFSLSKDKTADLTVISALDLMILFGALLLIALALLTIGRQYWRRLLGRSHRQRGDVLPPREEIPA